MDGKILVEDMRSRLGGQEQVAVLSELDVHRHPIRETEVPISVLDKVQGMNRQLDHGMNTTGSNTGVGRAL